MASQLPRIWLERPPLPDLRDEVYRAATILGPASATPHDPLQALAEAGGAVAGQFLYDARLMDRAPLLKAICRSGIGYDTVDLDAATARGIAVCNAPDGPTVSTAEHTIALVLAVAKNLKRSAARLRRGETDFYRRHEAVELHGRTLGLIGYGRISRRVAHCFLGLGMDVVAFDPYLAEDSFGDVTRAPTIADVLETADVVSVHVPLTDENLHMISHDEFAAMKDGSVFVNTARGGLVDQDALVAALDSGRLLGAGLDVTDPEPLPPDHPLLNRDDVVVTPHVASGTHEGKRRLFRMAFDQVLQVLRGERPPHLLNPEVWSRVSSEIGGSV